MLAVSKSGGRAELFGLAKAGTGVVVTNLKAHPWRVWRFYSKRATNEKNIPELLYDYSLGKIPTENWKHRSLVQAALSAEGISLRDAEYYSHRLCWNPRYRSFATKDEMTEMPGVKKILVTGGAGYIGSILTPALLAAGYEVTVLDNFMFRQTSLVECCWHGRFSVIRGDCRDRDVLRRAMRDQDVVIPLAALVGAPLCQRDPIAAQSTNRDAIKLLLSLRSPAQWILFPTTNSGYGIGEPGKRCTEETPLRPLTLYGTTKAEAEEMILEAGNAITFRLATVFGVSPRMRIDLLVNDFVYRAVMDRAIVVFEGHFKRNYIHVRDVARAFLWGLEHLAEMGDQTYNVGLNEANLSKLELCAQIKRHIPSFVYLEAPIGEDPDKRDYIVSNDKIYRTGFEPEYSLDMGIRELITAYTILRSSAHSNV